MVPMFLTRLVLEVPMTMLTEEEGKVVLANGNEFLKRRSLPKAEPLSFFPLARDNAPTAKMTLHTVWIVHTSHSDLAL